MIQSPAGSQIYLAAGKTDMRKGIPGLSALVRKPTAKDRIYVKRKP